MPKIAELTSIHISGIEELRDTLATLAPNEARNLLRTAVHGLATQVRDIMRERVPTDTKALRKSIKAVRRRGKPGLNISEVRVGHTAPYGIMTEFGTRNTPAQPYIVPSVEYMRPKMPQHYRDEFGKKLEKTLAKRGRKR